LAVSDFRGVLLHGCTGRRYKFRGTERVTAGGIDFAARNG
jgi:hypothetical protein